MLDHNSMKLITQVQWTLQQFTKDSHKYQVPLDSSTITQNNALMTIIWAERKLLHVQLVVNKNENGGKTREKVKHYEEQFSFSLVYSCVFVIVFLAKKSGKFCTLCPILWEYNMKVH